MKRSLAQRAIDSVFGDVLMMQYRNLLVFGLEAKSPDAQALAEQFSLALTINLEAHAIASKIIATRGDLED